MRIDIRNKIKDSFLYKRFAYNSEGFVALMEFLGNEGIDDEFYKECDFNKERLINDLKHNQDISIGDFFEYTYYSFSFINSFYGIKFWSDEIDSINFKKIEHKLL